MKPFNEGQEARIREQVEKRALEFMPRDTQFGFIFTTDPDAREHIINIGTSILATRWDIGMGGGSFVQAIVDNDLGQSFGRADHINVKAIHFYVSLLYNQGYIN